MKEKYIRVAVAPLATDHEQFIDVLRAPDVLLGQLLRPVTLLDHLRTIIEKVRRAVQISAVGDHLLDPPIAGVGGVGGDGHVGIVLGSDR